MTLVHDEQRYYAHVLRENKALAESLTSATDRPQLARADWNLSTPTGLVFAESQEPRIQAADILAGFLMHYVRNKLYRSSPTLPEVRAAFLHLDTLGAPPQGAAINSVLSDASVRRLGLVPHMDPWVQSGALGRPSR